MPSGDFKTFESTKPLFNNLGLPRRLVVNTKSNELKTTVVQRSMK